MRRYLKEAHRRSLWQVIVIYVAGAWFTFQVSLALVQTRGLPFGFVQFAVVLLIVGLPIVLITAFVQGGPPELGCESPESASTNNSATGEPGGRAHDGGGDFTDRLCRIFTWNNALLGGVAAFTLWAAIAATWLIFGDVDQRPPPAGTSKTVTEQEL